ncbi:galactosyldiacylglycerol synthase, partial [bacterium]|nr:galactosyldiacylglycerol synthase [bacterium]
MGTTEKKPHILVLSASTGGGHMRAAEGIEKCLLERHPSIDVTNVDMMNHVSWLFRTLYVDSYMDMMKHHRRLYELLYTMMDKEPEKMPMQRFRLWLQWLNSVSAHKALLKLGPDHIICTHFTAAEMLSRARRKGYNIPPTSVVVTDFDVHWMWIHRALDEFFVADHEAAARLATRGVAEEHIHVTGIPVCPGFARTYDAQEQKKALGLTPGTLTLMLMAGGFGVSSIDRTARRLLGHFGHLQLIAVAGRNEALRASLDRVAAEFPGRLAAIGFTTEVEKYMAASDLIISKPDGLTTSECM